MQAALALIKRVINVAGQPQAPAHPIRFIGVKFVVGFGLASLPEQDPIG